MRTSLSFNLTKKEASRARGLAKARGFDSTSEYLRFLIAQDDTDLIGEDELVRRSKDAERLHKCGKLMAAKSLSDLLR
jgi:hypothetical protein